jgi:hypothetical protein
VREQVPLVAYWRVRGWLRSLAIQVPRSRRALVSESASIHFSDSVISARSSGPRHVRLSSALTKKDAIVAVRMEMRRCRPPSQHGNHPAPDAVRDHVAVANCRDGDDGPHAVPVALEVARVDGSLDRSATKREYRGERGEAKTLLGSGVALPEAPAPPPPHREAKQANKANTSLSWRTARRRGR